MAHVTYFLATLRCKACTRYLAATWTEYVSRNTGRQTSLSANFSVYIRSVTDVPENILYLILGYLYLFKGQKIQKLLWEDWGQKPQSSPPVELQP